MLTGGAKAQTSNRVNRAFVLVVDAVDDVVAAVAVVVVVVVVRVVVVEISAVAPNIVVAVYFSFSWIHNYLFLGSTNHYMKSFAVGSCSSPH